MSHFFLAVCVALLISACSKEPGPEPKQAEVSHIHHAKVISVTTSIETRSSGNAGGDALVGGIAGAAVGFPATGAIIGAASSDDKRVVTSTEACKFSVEVNGKLLYFIGGKVGDASYKDIETCSLLTPGDVIEVLEYTEACPILGRNRGDPRSSFRWRQYCLRSAI